MCAALIRFSPLLILSASVFVHAAAPKAEKPNQLKGRLVFDGDPPAQAAIDVPKTRSTLDGKEFVVDELTHYASLGLKDQTLLVSKSGGLKNAIIWLSDKSVPIPPLPPVRRLPAPATLTFEGGQFRPQVLAWWGPQRFLELVNKDKYALNLRSEPILSETFNRLLPQGKSARFEVAAERLPILVRSDVNHWLPPAVIFPCAHPYFAVSDAEGRFSIANLPAGEWEFTTWHQRAGWLRTEAWPKGKFTQKIGAEEVDLGEIKIPKELFK